MRVWLISCPSFIFCLRLASRPHPQSRCAESTSTARGVAVTLKEPYAPLHAADDGLDLVVLAHSECDFALQ
tara:strand:- start:232 stop:444 length:213 start_codon:yes stop_codon:yes gene_type:complete